MPLGNGVSAPYGGAACEYSSCRDGKQIRSTATTSGIFRTARPPRSFGRTVPRRATRPRRRADELVVVEADDDPIEVERPLRPMIYVVQSHPWRARCIVAVFAAITLAGVLWLTPFPTFTIELLAVVVVALAVLTGPRWMRRVS